MELVLALADGTLDADEDEGDPVVWDEGSGDELGSMIDATIPRAQDDLVASTI